MLVGKKAQVGFEKGMVGYFGPLISSVDIAGEIGEVGVILR